MKVKRVDHTLSDSDDDGGDVIDEHGFSSSKKAVTKAAVARKLLKKNIHANQKVKFGDDGEVVVDGGAAQKKSQEGLDYERSDSSGPSGIDLEKARVVLRAEDATFDKKQERTRVKEMHKEKRRKEKEAKNRRRKERTEEEEEEEGKEEVRC